VRNVGGWAGCRRWVVSLFVAMIGLVTAGCGASGGGDAVYSPASVSVGLAHACEVLDDGGVACWGWNHRGQLGDGTTEDRGMAVRVVGIEEAVEVSAGAAYSCAVLRDGTVSCWGLNTSGQLGDGTTVNRLTPVSVQGLSDAVGVQVGVDTSCAVRRDGTVSCWGERGDAAQGGVTGSLTPVQLIGLDDVVDLDSRGGAWCARLSDGTVPCWDRGFLVQDGEETDVQVTLRAVEGISDAVDIGVGLSHVCVVRSGGTVSCVGSNFAGELGNGTVDPTDTVVTVPGIVDALEVSAGDNSTCVRHASGAVDCWGLYRTWDSSANGSNDLTLSPVSVPSLDDATELSTGTYTVCTRRADGGVYCWGSNSKGALGAGLDALGSPVPVAVLTLQFDQGA